MIRFSGDDETARLFCSVSINCYVTDSIVTIE